MTEMLATIRHDEGLPEGGRVLVRRAVKGVALRGREVLLLRSAELGALKFPGGGVEPGESDEDCLRRELAEECGARLMALGDVVGDVEQRARPKEPEYDVFVMVSRYVRCTVAPELGERSLDEYERRLGLTPVWLDVTDAVAVCRDLLASKRAVPRWVERELLVLRRLEDAARPGRG